MTRPFPLAALLVALHVGGTGVCGRDVPRPVIPESSVGLPVEVRELVLPGPELEAIPLDDETPVVIRIDAVRPHGTAHRYDLVVSALEPGTFDLRDFLRRTDGSGTGDLPKLRFAVQSLLPPGQVEPRRPETGELPWYWDYRLALSLLGGLWVGGLVALFRLGRRRSKGAGEDAGPPQPRSLADRLRPLVAEAMAGRIDSPRLAELERALIAFWRRRAGLNDLPPAESLSRLRADPEAGPLLVQLERWLHHPPNEADLGSDERNEAVTALLAPYADLPSDALEARNPADRVTGESPADDEKTPVLSEEAAT